MLREVPRALPRYKSSICNRNVTDFRRSRRCPGDYDVGANLRGAALDGQVSAGISDGNNNWLAARIVLCTVIGPCGSTLPASHKHLLFRTPSFRGQACVPHRVLSAVFFLSGLDKKRQKPAQFASLRSVLLHNKARNRHLLSKTAKNLEGQKPCESNEFPLRWQPARVWRPAVARPANRRSLAAVRGLWGRRSSVQIRCLGRQLGLRATCFTARPRTTVTKAEFNGAGKVPSVIAYHAVVGSTPRGGVLRFQNIKPKDVPCSTRS